MSLGALLLSPEGSAARLRGEPAAAAVEALDRTYREVILVKVEALHPQRTIAEPLDAEYRSLLELQEGLDVGRVFAALEEKMKSLERELNEGLDRSAAAFNGLLAALPV